MACVFAIWAAMAAAQEAKDMHLEDAGFVMRAADTPRKLERLRLLPPRRFIARTKAGGRYYLYADPDTCKCVFVGDQRAMQAYKDMVAQRSSLPDFNGSGPPSMENQIIQEMDDDLSGGIPDDDILDYRFQ